MENTLNLNQLNVNMAINNGLEYLLSKVNNGRWRGFPTLAGESDIWVTGFILSHILTLCKNQDSYKNTIEFLINSRQSTNGWSYSSIVPSDADSTAWCINALEKTNSLGLDVLERSKSFLWSHFVNSGISTYKVNSNIGNFISAPSDEFIAGWCAPHPDVSIAAILADIHHENAQEILDWLKSLSTKEGFIKSYWWRGPFYTTTLMLRAVHIRGEKMTRALSERLLKGLKNLQLDDGGFPLEIGKCMNPFSTALALEALTYLLDTNSTKEISSCAEALLNSQNVNGSWAGDFILRIPAPNVLDPETVAEYNNPDLGGNSFIQDRDGLFATTMACYALDVFRRTY